MGIDDPLVRLPTRPIVVPTRALYPPIAWFLDDRSTVEAGSVWCEGERGDRELDYTDEEYAAALESVQQLSARTRELPLGAENGSALTTNGRAVGVKPAAS